MGEEAKKPEEEKKKVEEELKPAAGDEKKGEESKEAPPPPPPLEVVLRVFMHCEGCARKVRRCLKGFDGVEDVVTDCRTHKVVVKGEKVDPMKVLERVQKKSHRKVELLSPVPKPPAEEEEAKKPEKEEPPKPEEKKDEPPAVITVVLKVHMHCEACAQEIRKRIQRMKGVESVVPDLKSSEVTVKGIFTTTELLDYVHKKTGKSATIVKQDPDPKSEEEKNGKDEKKDGKDGEKEEKKPDEGGEKQEPTDKPEDILAALEKRKNEYNYYYQPANYQMYPPRYAAEATYAYPPPPPQALLTPQMFSDENPNACHVM